MPIPLNGNRRGLAKRCPRSCEEVENELAVLIRNLDIQKLVSEWPTLSTFCSWA